MASNNRFKQKVHEILYSDPDKKGFLYRIDDYFITTLIILSVFVIMLESMEGIYRKYYTAFHIFDIFSVSVFTIEYFFRIWVADIVYPHLSPFKARLKYIFSFMGLIDFIAILPFYLPMLIHLDLRFVRILRLLRLFRIFKLAHYSKSIKMVGYVINDKKHEILITFAGTLILIILTATLMYEIEYEVQPDKFPNVFATLWWAVATLTTIGYGDVYPVTAWGQFLAAITALFGIGLVAIPTGILSMGFMEIVEKRKNEKKQQEPEKNEYNYCPHCGKKIHE